MDRNTYLLHQVHPAKLATDIGADVVSTWLMWHRRPRTALLLAHTALALASATVTRWDLSPLQTTRRVDTCCSTCHPAPKPCVTSAKSSPGYAAYHHRAGQHRRWGHVLIAAGWSHGLLPRTRTIHRPPIPLTVIKRQPVP